MQVYCLHNNGILNMDRSGVAGCFGHNEIAIFLPAAAQNFNQFFWG